MAEHLTVEAPSVAALVAALDTLPREGHTVVTATERGEPWACLLVRPLTDSRRSAFPCFPGGTIGDTRRGGQSGVMLDGADHRHAAQLVAERARRMFRL